MKILRDIKSIQEYLKNHRNKKIGLVPTMGAIHEGHLSLIKQAKKDCDLVVVSIFVNQKQFNHNQDYLNYPKIIEQDSIKIANIADILFCPNSEEIYPNNFATQISISRLTNYLCGQTRPGHFDGVVLIITKLFNIIKPDQAFFGEKDFQQLQIIRRLVVDLNMDVKVIGCKSIRQKDRLVLSSRNLLLDNKGQKIASKIYKNLCLAKKQILANNSIDIVLKQFTQNLIVNGFDKVDYAQVCDEETLQLVTIFNPKIKSRMFVAVYIGNVRLIDNIIL